MAGFVLARVLAMLFSLCDVSLMIPAVYFSAMSIQHRIDPVFPARWFCSQAAAFLEPIEEWSVATPSPKLVRSELERSEARRPPLPPRRPPLPKKTPLHSREEEEDGSARQGINATRQDGRPGAEEVPPPPPPQLYVEFSQLLFAAMDMSALRPPVAPLVEHCDTDKQYRQLLTQLSRPIDAWRGTFTWFISHKQWNALMHSLEGNTSPDNDDETSQHASGSQGSAAAGASATPQQARRWRAPPIGALVRPLNPKNKKDECALRVQHGAL